MGRINRKQLAKQLDELRAETIKGDEAGWADYEWMTGRGDFVEGQISILEVILE